MPQKQEVIKFLIRLLFSILVIIIGLKQIQETNNLIKSSQDTIYKAKNFLYSLKIYNIGFLYKIIPRLILVMNYSLIGSAILFIFKINGYMLFIHNSIIIQFLLVNNILLDNSSKCYLIASTYLSIYGGFYYLE